MRREEIRQRRKKKQFEQTAYKAALYHRLSDEDGRDNEDNSIGNQHKICQSYVEGQPDIEIVDTYVDNGYSGGNFNRPDFQRMLQDMENGRINCIIVKDLSRFGRNFLEVSEYLEKWFPAKEIRFIAVNNGYDNIQPDSGKEGIVIPFSNMINEMYLRDTSRKIRSSIEIMMKKGEFLPASGSIPYGYLRDEQNCTYKVDEEPAKVVMTIFQRKAEGCSNCSIATYLNGLMIPSPGKLRFLRGMSNDKRNETALWTHGAIRDILNNEVYLGHRIYGKLKRDRVGEVKTRKNREDWQYIYNAHPAIIKEDLFRTVQDILQKESDKRQNMRERTATTQESRELLLHKVYCGDCGSLMSAMKRNQRIASSMEPKIFYQCNGYVYSGRKKCGNHYFSQDNLISILTKAIQTQVSVVADLEKLGKMRIFAPETDRILKMQSEIVSEIRRKLRVQEGQLVTLLNNYNSGILELDEFLYIKGKYETERQLLEKQLAEALKDAEKAQEAAKRRRRWLDVIGDYRENPLLHHALIDALIDRILIFEDKSIEIVFRYKDEFEQAAQIAGREVS